MQLLEWSKDQQVHKHEHSGAHPSGLYLKGPVVDVCRISITSELPGMLPELSCLLSLDTVDPGASNARQPKLYA